jgi:hypothetical protein
MSLRCFVWCPADAWSAMSLVWKADNCKSAWLDPSVAPHPLRWCGPLHACTTHRPRCKLDLRNADALTSSPLTGPHVRSLSRQVERSAVANRHRGSPCRIVASSWHGHVLDAGAAVGSHAWGIEFCEQPAHRLPECSEPSKVCLLVGERVAERNPFASCCQTVRACIMPAKFHRKGCAGDPAVA